MLLTYGGAWVLLRLLVSLWPAFGHIFIIGTSGGESFLMYFPAKLSQLADMSFLRELDNMVEAGQDDCPVGTPWLLLSGVCHTGTNFSN